MHSNVTIYFPDVKRVEDLQALAIVKSVSLSVLILDLIEKGLAYDCREQTREERPTTNPST